MTKGSGDARMQPLYFLITTAGNDTNSICYEVHQKAKDILEGRKSDHTFYPVIYGADEGDDWTDPEVWKKANPSLGITVGIDKVKQRESDLGAIIKEEKLKEQETRQFMENAFREGEVKTVGTDIDKILPPVSRFGGGGRAKKKQSVIEKLKGFFEKYFGIGGSTNFARIDPDE